jgi:hypothetical protein
MSIIYDPKTFVKKIAPESKIKKLLSKTVTVKKTALSFVDAAEFIDKKAVSKVALKTVKSYQERIAKVQAAAGEKSAGNEIQSEILDDPKLLIQRVQNEVIYQVHNEIKSQYKGQQAVWLPSSSDEPRPQHQANYGKTYIIGEGIDGVEPGDEIGCNCGIEILVNETELQLE